MIIPCHAPSNVYSTPLAFAVALLQLWQLLTSAETTSDDRGLHMKMTSGLRLLRCGLSRALPKKTKKFMSKLSNALFHSTIPLWCPVNPASDATLVLGRDPEMHRSQNGQSQDKATKGRWMVPPNMPLWQFYHSKSKDQIVSNSVKGLFFNEAKMAEAKGRSATTACDELPPDRNTNQIRKKERKKAIFWSSDCLSLVVCFSQPSVGVELSSTASGSGSLQHKGGGMVAELLVLRILLGTIPSLDNRTGQKTENARKKESECVWWTEKASWWQRQASKHKCSSSSICVGSWKLFCLWAFSIWHHLTMFHQKCTRFHHVCPFSRFSYAAKYQLAASDCTQHRRSARAHIALRQPWRWMQFPNICLSGKQNDEISVWTNDFRSMFT